MPRHANNRSAEPRRNFRVKQQDLQCITIAASVPVCTVLLHHWLRVRAGAPVVGPHDRLDGGGGLLQVVVRDLGQQVVHHVRPDVVVDLVEDPVVAVQRREAAPQVAPLLRMRCGGQ